MKVVVKGKSRERAHRYRESTSQGRENPFRGIESVYTVRVLVEAMECF